LSLGRYGVNLGFVERPLFAGFVWGAVTGDMALALSLAVFYELFWLDLFPAGTYMPPNALFPLLCVLTLSQNLADPGIATLFLPVIVTLPLAAFGAYIEKRQREWQVTGYNRVVLRLRAGGDIGKAAGRSVSVSLAQSFICNGIAFFIAANLIVFAASLLTAWKGGFPVYSHASWPLLWVIGAVGGMLSLRLRRNYLLFTIGGTAIALSLLLPF
jgi:PTS system mannose-specific IIC component